MVFNGSDKVALLATLGLSVLVFIKNRRRINNPLPPGPKKLPLLGNLLDMPIGEEWKTYARWSKEHDSDVIHISVAGSELVILNSMKAVSELLDKRSATYSSRPHFVMIDDLMGWGWLISAMPYGERWRERRRLFTQHFHLNNVSHQPIEVEFIRKMLIQLLESPEDFLDITRHTIGGMALTFAYGLPIQEKNDPYITLAEEGISSLAAAALPGAFLVDLLPWLKYIPEWFPGAGFQKKAKYFRQLQENFRNLPFEATIQNMAAGTARPSFTSTCLEDIIDSKNRAHQEEVIKDTAGIVFGAGADTTVSAAQTMLLAMMSYPDVQRKAQEELDRVVRGRLPDFNDLADLPYISAVVKEVFRWQPVTPLVPHFSSEDDVYEGYFIPKNAIIIGNAWAILHDEAVYPDPSTFNPERFLTKEGNINPDVPDPALAAFGFGRRICPGSHIAMSTLWIFTATMLSTFQISKAVDENGVPIEADLKYISSIIAQPAPFKCSIKPRSGAAEDLIRSAADSYE